MRISETTWESLDPKPFDPEVRKREWWRSAMVVRIKMKKQKTIAAVGPAVAEVAELAGALMTPASVLAFVFGGWTLAADLGMAGQFAIARGAFSHWMVWLAVGVLFQVIGASLRSRSMTVPTWLKQSWR